MGKWINSNIRHTVTNGPLAVQICQRCSFDPKQQNPFWDRCLVNDREYIQNFLLQSYFGMLAGIKM